MKLIKWPIANEKEISTRDIPCIAYKIVIHIPNPVPEHGAALFADRRHDHNAAQVQIVLTDQNWQIHRLLLP